MEPTNVAFARKLHALLSNPEIARKLGIEPDDASLIEGELHVIGVQETNGNEYFIEVKTA